MGYNGSGGYSLPGGALVSDGTSADAADLNAPLQDLETALNLAFLRDGRAVATGNFAMGSNKLTGLAAGTAATDSVTLAQVQSGVVQHATTVNSGGGTVDALRLGFTPASTTLTANEKIRWASPGLNTVAAPTLSKDGGVTNTTIKKGAGAALDIGDTGASGYICEAVYNGTDWILQNPAAIAGTATVLTGTNATMPVTSDAVAALWEQGTAVASAATVTLGDGGYFNITGTTTITDIDFTTTTAGREVELRFSGALTVTHNATNLILPGGANIITAAGDVLTFRSEGGDVVRCTKVHRATPFVRVNIGLLSAGTDISAAHGITGGPAYVSAYAECLTAEHGYAIGDRINIGQVSTGGYGMEIYWNATDVGFRQGSGTGMTTLTAAGGTVVMTGARWRIFALCFRLP